MMLGRKRTEHAVVALMVAVSGCAAETTGGDDSKDAAWGQDSTGGTGASVQTSSGGEGVSAGGTFATGGGDLLSGGGDPGAGGTEQGAGGALVGTGGGGAPADCSSAVPPEGGLLTWLHAADLALADGASLSDWPSRQGASFGSGSATLAQHEEGESTTVRFNGSGQRLYSSIPVSGLDDLTIALVARTTVLDLAGADWCQDFNMALSENGCSGTFNTPIMWDEAGDWGFTYLGAVQEQVSFRLGTGNKTYSNLDDPAIQVMEYDPNVAWVRSASINDALTSTVLQKEGGQMRLFVDSELVLEQGLPGGAAPLKNMHDTVWLGGGRGDTDWGGEIAELLVYGRKLSAEETEALGRYLSCEHTEIN